MKVKKWKECKECKELCFTDKTLCFDCEREKVCNKDKIIELEKRGVKSNDGSISGALLARLKCED